MLLDPTRFAPIALAALAACSSAAATSVETVTGACLCAPSVRPASASMNVGDRVQFTVDPSSSGYTVFRWRSSNPGVATVDSLTGVTTGVGLGQATIIAAAVKDPTVQGAAAVSIGSSSPGFDLVLESVNEVATGLPANLNAITGDIDLVASLRGTVSLFTTASLVVNNGLRDTVVATQTLPAGATARWTLRWSTAAKANGTAVFPNSEYRLRVDLASSSGTVSTNHIPATVVNP